MKSRLSQLLKELRDSDSLHTEVSLKLGTAYGGALYSVDLLAWATINRSISLIHGFETLVEKRNFIAAAPLLRLQLDNCLRFYAVYLVSDSHKFAANVLKGCHVRKMKDKNNALMTDGYLVSRLAEHHPWIERVYKRTSGYIHLSEAHIVNIFVQPRSDPTDLMNISIGVGDNFSDETLYEEATEAFIAATQILFKYLIGWLQTKENPSTHEQP